MPAMGLVDRCRVAFLCNHPVLQGVDLSFRLDQKSRHIGSINTANMTPKAREQRRNF